MHRRITAIDAATPTAARRCRPHPAAGNANLVLCGHVVTGIAPVRQRQALSHEPLVDVDLAHETAADDPPVAVDIALVTGHGAPADQILQRQGRPLAAAPVPAGCIETGLAAFRRIYAVQPDAMAMDLDGVGVDDGGDADHVGVGDAPSRDPEGCSDDYALKYACRDVTRRQISRANQRIRPMMLTSSAVQS